MDIDFVNGVLLLVKSYPSVFIYYLQLILVSHLDDIYIYHNYIISARCILFLRFKSYILLELVGEGVS